MRRRPRVTVCEHQLLYGVVSVEDKGGEGSHVRPLAGARVSIVAAGQAVVSTTTRRDGSYSVVVGSCQTCEHSTEYTELRVVKEEPCMRFNATRTVHTGNSGCDERLLRRQDVTVYEKDAMGLCAVTMDTREPRVIMQLESYRDGVVEGDITRHASAITTIVALLWGLFLLWSIARWGSAGHRRQRRHTRSYKTGDLDSDALMELRDYPFTLLSNKDSRRRDHGMEVSLGPPTHLMRPSTIKPRKAPGDDNASDKVMAALRLKRSEGRVIVDGSTEDK